MSIKTLSIDEQPKLIKEVKSGSKIKDVCVKYVRYSSKYSVYHFEK